jgi:hypothetical protein
VSDFLTSEWFKGAGPNKQPVTITLTEDQRQTVILALANLSMERPGWCMMLEEIALLMDNKLEDGRPQMFEDFRRIWTSPLVEKILTAG